MDAVRAQNLPFFGYHRNTTPLLASLKEDLTIYENAVSSAYWTMPSVASLFTGMYKSSHGLFLDGDKLNPSLRTIPGILKQQGYRCAAFVRNLYLSDYSGLTRDFDELFFPESQLGYLKKRFSPLSGTGAETGSGSCGIDSFPSRVPLSRTPIRERFFHAGAQLATFAADSGGSRLVTHFIDWIKTEADGPFFAYIHFLETHSPYWAPLSFALNFLSPAEIIKKLFVSNDHLRFSLGIQKMTSEDFRILTAAYDNAISYVDHLIAKIIRTLKQLGKYDDTMIIVLSDHGDNIGDHGLMFHYWCLYDTLIKIPLLIKYPRGTGVGGRIMNVVQNVDLFPTILALLNETDEKAWAQLQGNDLTGRTEPRRPGDFAISELIKPFGPDRKPYRDLLNKYDRRLLSVRTKTRKFIYSSRGDHECYNLIDDPAESKNLYLKVFDYKDLEQIATGYYYNMNNFYNSNRHRIDDDFYFTPIDEEVMSQLKSLGYL
jgi:arylsulfatase A-like enzyme